MLADLYGNKARSALVVASIAVGVFAIGVIAGAYVLLSQDLASSYEASNPANITLVTLPFGEDVVEAVARTEGVAVAEGARELTVRVRAKSRGQDDVRSQPLDTTWDNLVLVARPAIASSSINRRFTKDGTGMPDDREIVLEHQTLDALGIAVGDQVEIELGDGTRRRCRSSARPLTSLISTTPCLGGLRGYITLDTLPWLHSQASMTKLFVTVTGDSDDKAHIRQVAGDVTERLERNGYPGLPDRGGRHSRAPLWGHHPGVAVGSDHRWADDRGAERVADREHDVGAVDAAPAPDRRDEAGRRASLAGRRPHTC